MIASNSWLTGPTLLVSPLRNRFWYFFFVVDVFFCWQSFVCCFFLFRLGFHSAFASFSSSSFDRLILFQFLFAGPLFFFYCCHHLPLCCRNVALKWPMEWHTHSTHTHKAWCKQIKAKNHCETQKPLACSHIFFFSHCISHLRTLFLPLPHAYQEKKERERKRASTPKDLK